MAHISDGELRSFLLMIKPDKILFTQTDFFLFLKKIFHTTNEQ